MKKAKTTSCPKPVFLEGKRVNLCTLDPKADLKHYTRWVNDVTNTEYMGIGRYPLTQDKLVEHIKRYNGSQDFLLGIFLKKSKRHIGNITLHYMDSQNRNAEIGILIGEKQYHGQGLGKEATALLIDHAFNRLNLHKITTGMVGDNIPSKKMFENLGFVQEGNLREQFYLKGRYLDSLRYGLLASEWQALKNKNQVEDL